jgi:hypothetical protein
MAATKCRRSRCANAVASVGMRPNALSRLRRWTRLAGAVPASAASPSWTEVDRGGGGAPASLSMAKVRPLKIKTPASTRASARLPCRRQNPAFRSPQTAFVQSLGAELHAPFLRAATLRVATEESPRIPSTTALTGRCRAAERAPLASPEKRGPVSCIRQPIRGAWVDNRDMGNLKQVSSVLRLALWDRLARPGRARVPEPMLMDDPEAVRAFHESAATVQMPAL